ncbi:MAG: tetratricopeptide repeat protein [Planctomycetota bacterium]|jgi:tetratricopeptide (TPR) repeat protein
MRNAMVIFLLAATVGAAEPRTANESLEIARGQVEQGQLEDAWETLDEALEAYPKDVRLCIALGDVFLQLASGGQDASAISNYYFDAERMYDAALTADPKSADAVFGKARANFSLSGMVAGSKQKAAAAVSRCLALDPAHRGALALKGHLLYGERKYAEAARCYERAERDVTVSVRIGHCAYAQGKSEEAKKGYIEALRRHPDSDIPIRSGLYHLAGKDWRKTVDLLCEATDVAPQSVPAWFYLGYAHYTRKDWEPAIYAFGKAGELDPKYSNAHYYRGAAMVQHGDGDRAFRPLRRALQANPAHREAADAFDRQIRAARRRNGKFMWLYDQLLELAPDNPWIRNNYAYSLRDRAEMSGAANTAEIPDALRRMLRRSAEVYEQAARLRPDDPQIQSDTGLIHEFYPAIHDDKKAAAYFTRALDLTDSRYRDALNGLIRLCERTRDWKILHQYTSEAAAAFAGGERGLYPTEAGEILPTSDLGTKLLRAEVESALALAKYCLFHAGTGRKLMVPVVREERGDVPQGWRIVRPASEPRGQPVKLFLDLTPGAAHSYKARVTSREGVAGTAMQRSTRTFETRLVVDDVEERGIRTTWTSVGDDAVGEGCLIARVNKAGRVRDVEAIDVANVRLEPKVAAAMRLAIVPLPERPVRVGETWPVPLGSAMVFDSVLPMWDAEVRGEAYQTLVGFESVDGEECARIQMVFAATIRSRSLMMARHMGRRTGTLYVKGSCVILHGRDGHARRIVWNKQQWCRFDPPKNKPKLPPRLAAMAKAGLLREAEMRRSSTWEFNGSR